MRGGKSFSQNTCAGLAVEYGLEKEKMKKAAISKFWITARVRDLARAKGSQFYFLVKYGVCNDMVT